MSFPAKVKEDALVACGRHCCLCHKFCGLKIELHHITPHSEEGKDTFDHCIPLCFDCHADMSTYDKKHPKGTKYTKEELRRQRDQWYRKVKNSLAISSLPEHLEIDRGIYQRVQELLPWDKAIDFIRYHDFGGPFQDENISYFMEFVWQCEDPAFEFIDADLEGIRGELQANTQSFLHGIQCETFPAGPGKNGVPPEWRHEQQDRFKRVVEQLHHSAENICECYDGLVKLGRRKLGVE